MTGKEFFVHVASKPPMSKLHPRVGEFMKGYLEGEKAIHFGDSLVVNTQFPPFPSRAFDSMAEFFISDKQEIDRLYSVTFAITNRCMYNCWHCYNAGRPQKDVPLSAIRDLAGRLQARGAVMVTLTGGEPLLRDDLEDICRAFSDSSCLIVGTTGWGLTAERAKRLKDAGVFAIGISLDSTDLAEHDKMRGKAGAFATALEAVKIATGAGLYPYFVSVATREFLRPKKFWPFLQFARDCGALEVHLLEPCPTGRLAGNSEVALGEPERKTIIDYQFAAAKRQDLPILSTYTYLESPQAFGCGAGLTHIYVDGSGELCPCNLVPMSFGNVFTEGFEGPLERMRRHFKKPCSSCLGRVLSRHVEPPLPCPAEKSEEICSRHLKPGRELPEYFKVRRSAVGSAGKAELSNAYDRVFADYDDFWVVQAGQAVRELVERLKLAGSERVFEAGCGSGFGTALLAGRLAGGGSVLAADISDGMLSMAKKRIGSLGASNVAFRLGDAMELLASAGPLDLVFTTWVLGYIPLDGFFAAAAKALAPAGRLGLVVHRENSPKRESEIFANLVAIDPSVLSQKVAFDFPRDVGQIREKLAHAGMALVDSWESSAVFSYPTAREVFEHLLKSGAGTVFYDSIVPARRDELTRQFIRELERTNPPGQPFEVRHDYIGCIAGKKR